MNKKYHEKFKILDILAVTTQACEGIETPHGQSPQKEDEVTTQACEGIETIKQFNMVGYTAVTTQACEGIETHASVAELVNAVCNNSSL